MNDRSCQQRGRSSKREEAFGSEGEIPQQEGGTRKEVQQRNSRIQQNENKLKQREISLNQRQEDLGRRKMEIDQYQQRVDNEKKLLSVKQQDLEKCRSRSRLNWKNFLV